MKKRLWKVIAVVFAGLVTTFPVRSQPASGFYEITSGIYAECCGIAGESRTPLPDQDQRYVSLSLDSENGTASMAFLADDGQTVFSRYSCPVGGDIQFHFDFGFVFGDEVEFRVDPGPPPAGLYWSYVVTNSLGVLQIDGMMATATGNCSDSPTQFKHEAVRAELVPPPIIQISDVSAEGPLLILQGRAGWTDVIEASTNLVEWIPVSTNLMPATVCPTCPFIQFRDTNSLNLSSRFYRAFQMP